MMPTLIGTRRVRNGEDFRANSRQCSHKPVLVVNKCQHVGLEISRSATMRYRGHSHVRKPFL